MSGCTAFFITWDFSPAIYNRPEHILDCSRQSVRFLPLAVQGVYFLRAVIVQRDRRIVRGEAGLRRDPLLEATQGRSGSGSPKSMGPEIRSTGWPALWKSPLYPFSDLPTPTMIPTELPL